MAIPASQLETWSHQGSITQSSNTYNTIKNVLEAAGTPYAAKSYEVFLQGSYANDTNIFAESDVDIVIRLESTFYKDLSELSEGEKKAYDAAYSTASYQFRDFKKDVLKVLTDRYGGDVKAGDKAIAIAAGGGRRKADVIVSTQYRRYFRFNTISDQSYAEGICFFNNANQEIANYPKQHSANCTTKHRDTSGWFKPVVRIFKNMGDKMVEKSLLAKGVAPSYYLEGLLYNVPNGLFTRNYETCVVNALNWVFSADKATKDNCVCANEQYYLLREPTLVTWGQAGCDAFVAAARRLWNEW